MKIRVLLASTLLLAACANPNQSPPDTITTILSAPVQSLNPLYASDANSQHVNELIHSSLVTISDQLIPEPYLAQEFHFVNPTTLEFTLRKGCIFESGREIHSDDVAKSLAFIQDEKNKSVKAMKRIKKFERVDDYKFRLLLEKPSLSLVADLELLKIMNLDGISTGDKPEHIPGAGPYKLVSLSPSLISLERANAGCLPIPPTPKIKIKIVRDDLSRYLKLQRGELDIVQNEMNFRKLEVIAKDEKTPLRVATSDGIGYSYLGLNMTNPKLQDPRVREAIALSLDIPSLIKYKSRGMAQPGRNILADFNYYANTNVPIVTRNLERARQLLDEAGYFNGSNGKPPLKLSLKTTTSMVSVENARVIAAQAKEAGIEINHQAYEWGIFYADVKTGNTELYQLRWVGVTDPRIYFEVFHSGEIGRNNRTRYKNPELDKMIEKGEATVDLKARKVIYDEVQATVAKDLPYIGLWYGKNVAVYRKELSNVKMPPNGSWRNLLEMRKTL
jgi:peptide/nickel transport system substrate-binding protein